MFFVADHYNNRIQKFTNTGTFVTLWGVSGSEDGLFKFPYGVAVDSSGNVFVAEYGNNRIQKFTNQGDFIRKWGMLGTGPGKFKQPVDLDVSNPGILVFKENTYVADFLNNRIQVFTWKPDVQPTTNLNLNLKGSLQNNNNLLLLVNNQDTISISNCREEKS
jgi:sugar lactone lactonase YvrE